MPLPKAKTPPKQNTSDFTILIYGPTGIGKSTWCSHAEGALFIATEAGLNALDVYQQPVTTWEELLDCCAEIADGKHDFKTIIMDTADNAYKMCADYICRKHNILHQSDLEYGKGWALVNNEFQRVLIRLSALPYGLYLISHSVEKEIDTRTGKRVHTRPTLPDKMRSILLGMVDVIGFCDVEPPAEGDKATGVIRVMRTKPNPCYEAKDRTGRLPETLPLDFAAFRKAFQVATNGKVKSTTTPKK
jgi:hypothetical protein